MKLLAIRGKHLGALFDFFELDFQQAPLKNCGLFAITGATGAGKSTILDALCLALYNNSARLEKSGKGKWHNDLHANDPRTLLHENASDAFCEVDFVGRDGGKYRAKWQVRRARGNLKGKLQAVEMSLKNLLNETDESCKGKSNNDILKAIEKKVGLSFKQFTKTILLAQNDFANFLNASDNERAEILQMLMGGDIFQKISQKVFIKNNEKSTLFNFLNQKMENQNVPTEEEKECLEKELKNIFEKKQTLTVEKMLLEEQKKWWERYNELNHSFVNEKENFLKLENTFKENELEFKNLNRQHSAYALEDLFLNFKKTEKEKNKIQQDLLTHQHNLKNAQQNLKIAENEFKKIQKQVIDFEEYFSKQNPLFKQAEELDHSILILENDLKKEKEVFQSFENEKKQNLDKLLDFQNNLNEKENLLNQKTTWLKNKNKYRQLTMIWDSMQDFLKINWGEKIKQNKIELENQNTQLNQLESIWKNAKKEYDFAQNNLFEFEKDLKKQFLNELSIQLKHNEPCPLCGALVHPKPFLLAENNANNDENNFNHQKWENLKRILNEKQNNFYQKEKAFLLNKQNVENLKQEEENLQKEWKNFLNCWDLKLKSISENWQNKFLNDSVSFYQKAKNSVLEYQKILKEKEQLENEVDILNEQKNNLEENLNQTIEKLKKYNLQKNENEKQLNDLKEKRKMFFHGEDLNLVRQNFEKQKENLNQNQNFAWQKEENLKMQCQRMLDKEKELNCNQNEINEEFLNLNENLNLKMKELNFILDDLENYFYQPKDVFNQKWNDYENLKKQKEKIEILIKTRENDLKNHKDKKPKNLNENFDDLILELNNKNNEIHVLESEKIEKEIKKSEMQNACKEFEELQNQLQQAQKECNLWAGMNDLIGSAKGEKFRRFAQEYTLDVLLHKANQQLGNLWKRYALVRSADSLNLGVKDLLLGSMRSVKSLSGGETFLVSLALALGLANLNDSSGFYSDTLLIDEGFGALDKNSLDLVMKALESLQAAGRMVGVISHIEAMQERIAVQVFVQKQNSGSVVKVQ